MLSVSNMQCIAWSTVTGAMKCKCLSEARNSMHSVYMVFENADGKNNFVPSPASHIALARTGRSFVLTCCAFYT